MTPAISQAADDLIIASEVSSRAYYEKTLRRPEWPGGQSGVTIAIGYDLGYATEAKVHKDWGGRVPDPMIDAMADCVGVTGDAAHRLLPSVRNKIDVPWDDAIYVYEHVDIPEWTDRVCRAIPKADHLPPDCIGALTSLAYNRGASFQTAGDRYREMRAIRSHVIAGELDQVDDEIRAMERLWPDMKGLRIRRERESALWNKGLIAPPVPLPKSKPSEAPPLLVPVPKSGAPEAGTAAGGTTVTGTAAQQAAQGGLDPWLIAGIIAVGVVITVGTVAYVRYRRQQPMLARAKG